MANKHFSSMPNISIPRSRWKQDFSHPFTMNHGQLIPVDCFEVVPGDGFAGRYSFVIRMSTPIAPIMGNIKAKLVAFYVPWRLLWEHTEEFYGANKTSAGYQTTTYKIPSRSLYRNGVPVGSVSHHLGKPLVTIDNNKTNYGVVSILKERAYWFIWSEWYRAQQLQNPFLMNKQDGAFGNALIGTIDGSYVGTQTAPANVCKEFDYFTACTIAPQYGAAVSLPLGSYAPVVTLDSNGEKVTSSVLQYIDTEATPPFGSLNVGANGQLNAINGDSATGYLVTDLSQATAATINSIRYAFQLQKYLERSNFGTRFFEMLNAHYGVTSPDSRLQRPEYLGGYEFPLVVQQVLSTAGYKAGTDTEVGQPGATSITAVTRHLFSKDFVEPGFVMVMLSTTHERVYSQGLLREDFLFDRFEHYSPEFANLGDQAILNKEIMLTGDSTDESVFGYQEHWAELRYRKSYVSGLLDPNASNALDFWTLAEKYASRPSLSASWITENRDALTRALVTGATGPDYICDMYASYVATREMPVYTIPGLVDHFGVM